MSKKILIIILMILFLFISCDESFNASSPFSYDKGVSKIEGKCRSNGDCKEGIEICDITKETCVPNPCYDTLTKSTNTICGSNGECIPQFHEDSDADKICKCNEGYDTFLNPETDKIEFICKKNCDNLLSCKEDNHKVSCTQDKYSVITCACSEDYKQTEDAICINPCKDISCGANEHCVANNDLTTNCVCDDNYFPNPSNNNVCESPCEGHENCSLDNIERLGECSSTGLSVESVTCDCVINMQVDENNPLLCVTKNPCKNIDCNEHGQCNLDGNNEPFCTCADGYQDYNNDLKCNPICNIKDCTYLRGECKYYNDLREETPIIPSNNEDKGKKYCDCEYNYYQGNKNNNGVSDTLGEYIECFSPCDQNTNCSENIVSYDSNCDYPIGSCQDGIKPCDWNDYTNKCEYHHSGEARGECIATSLTEAYCNCDEGYQDTNNNLSCNVSCDNSMFDCNSHGSCGWLNGENQGIIECTCPEGYSQNSQKTGCDWNGYAWTKTIGGINGDFARSIVTDNNGNIYITGVFNGTMDFDPSEGVDEQTPMGASDIFITKLNNDGSYGWTKRMNAGSVYSIVIDNNGNIYIVGVFNGIVDFDPSEGVDEHSSNGFSDVFITKLNTDGSYGWSKTMGGIGTDYAYSIAVDNNGNIYITGYFYDRVDFDPSEGIDEHTSNGDTDIFITKLNSDASYGWTKTLGGLNYDDAKSITTDNNGNIYIVGVFYGIVDFDPSEGIDEHTSTGGADMFITKLNNDASYGWTKIMNVGGIADGLGVGTPSSIVTDNNGNIYITGSFIETVDFDPSEGVDEHTSISNGDTDIFITKLNSDASYGWTKTLGGLNYDDAKSITTDNNGNIYLTGVFSSTVDFDPSVGVDEHTSNGSADIFITKLNTDGSYSWTKTMGGGGFDNVLSLTTDNNKNLYIAGYFKETIDFDPSEGVDEHTSKGDFDIFLWKFVQNEPTCDNINCNNHGICQTDVNNNPFCTCDIGYQDNEADLYCEPSCDNPDINNCGSNGTCDDTSGNVVCVCDDNFHLNGNFQCIAD